MLVTNGTFVGYSHIRQYSNTTKDSTNYQGTIKQPVPNSNMDNQKKPNRKSWNTFMNALQSAVMYESGKLKTPLGPWIRTYKKWKAYYNNTRNIVYVYENHWYKHQVLQATRNLLKFSRE
eukprot:8096589-Ditylum_brightwellii.AAC.1